MKISKTAAQNTQIGHLWFQILEFLFLRETLQLDKFEGVNFKYENSFFKFLSKITQKKDFRSHFYFYTKSCN